MRLAPFIGLSTILLSTSFAAAQWVEFIDVTDSALVLDPLYATNDNIEKDFEWGDFDRDGDIDLVVMRKFPGSVEGGAKDLLLLNEGGVLIDYTDLYASSSDVAGDGGFLAMTNDRDVKAADVNGDGWLDLVTCTTMSDNLNTILGQPRVYINLKNNQMGEWRGFQFQNNRIPVLFAANGTAANPRLCALDVEDLTGDGYPDIYFVDYDTPETSGNVCIDLNLDGDTNDVVDGVSECNPSPAETSSKDFQGKLLINQGAANPGFFVDSTTTRMTSAQLSMAFGNEVHIHDVNNDGLNDVIRVNTLTGGQDVAVYYNNPANPGMSFTGPSTIVGNAPYGMNMADLNNDGMVDVVVADDGQDAYIINNGGGSTVSWTRYVISDSLGEFGNGIQIADLDNDGWLDVMICDVDADLPPFCPSSGRRMHIYHNTHNLSSLLDEDGLVLPSWALDSTYDVAPIDLNGDGWTDLVVGACYGIAVFYNDAPIGMDFTYPDGRPNIVAPGETTDVNVAIQPVGGTTESGSELLWTSINNAPYTSSPLSEGGTAYVATLPAMECGQSLSWYISADLLGGSTYRDPLSGGYAVLVADGFAVTFEDDMESGTNGWTTSGSATAGDWELADPNGTTSSGQPIAPSDDYTDGGTMCWVTQNGVPGGSAGATDLDGGPVMLTSPVLDLSDSDATISFAMWFRCSDAGNSAEEDFFTVQITDGGTWTTVMSVDGSSTSWTEASFNVSDYVQPTANVQVRFVATDEPNNSLTEAAIDDFKVEALECESSSCSADFNGDGQVDGADMGIMLALWGTAAGDISGDGETDGADLGLLLTQFGTDC
jgi:hypothetical protein